MLIWIRHPCIQIPKLGKLYKRIVMDKLRLATRMPRRCNLRNFRRNSSNSTEQNEDRVQVSEKLIEQLERLSLVNFENKESVKRLEAAIRFARQLQEIEIPEGTKPMYTVVENERLQLREDNVTDGGYPNKILKNAVLTDEGYFVAPVGNIPVVLTRKEE